MSELGLIVATSVLLVGLLFVLSRAIRKFAAPPPLAITSEWVEKLCGDASLLQMPHLPVSPEQLRRLEESATLIRQALAQILVESPEDRPDLALALLRNQITFTYRKVIARFRT